MTASRKPLIALAAGGTGGHVFPALAVAEALHSAGVETLMMTDHRGARLIPAEGRVVLPAGSPFQRGVLARLSAMVKLGTGRDAGAAVAAETPPGSHGRLWRLSVLCPTACRTPSWRAIAAA
jgi:UDP-N-acetylglucosamine--N-acetylmuramyl-(pentapeptide) pyrophosphoryl-undecaprenol N-acetylglucosamine transferase